MEMKIGIIVQGLFEKSDSIGYDAVFQYKILQSNNFDCRIYAEKADKDLYKDINILDMNDFYRDVDSNLDIVIYHFCDGWKEIDNFVLNNTSKFIVRWHNNTPPWFYVFKQKRYALRSLHGFEAIAKFAENDIRIMANSQFTAEQFNILGGSKDKSYVVFPGSRYLLNSINNFRNKQKNNENIINVLFVGRFVAHKGHRNMIHLCQYIENHSNFKVSLHIVGRGDRSLYEYNEEIENLSNKSSVDINVYGEVTEEKLYQLYDTADVFLFLSEHEGFGLPVFEAMSRDLPVVAWRTSALDELLESHPLAFKEFNIERFAAAILALKERKIIDPVLEIQHHLSKIYSLSNVSKQIASCVEGIHISLENHYSKKIENLYDYVRETLESVERNYQLPASSSSFLHDFSGNFVSKYDIKIFKEFFRESLQTGINSIQNLTNGRVNFIEIGCEQFSSHNGKIMRDYLLIPRRSDKKHIIFGPYLSVKKGFYEIDFIFNTVAGYNPLINIEILTQENGVIGNYKKRLSQSFGIKFSLPSDDSNLEFRISCKTTILNDIIFKKAILKRNSSVKEYNFLEPCLFSTHEGKILEDTISFPTKKYSNKDIIFGPYVELDAGEYTANIFIENINNETPINSRLLIIDESSGVIKEYIGYLNDLININFSIKKKTIMEIRISIIGDFDGGVVFFGCELTKFNKNYAKNSMVKNMLNNCKSIRDFFKLSK